MRDGSATKELIRRTALALFVEQGVKETTIRDIAGRAGIAEGTMYRHYESKDELAWDLFGTNLLGLGAEFDEIRHQHSTMKAQSEAIIRRFCAFFDDDPVLFSYLLHMRHAHQKKITPRMRTPFAVIQDTVVAAIKRGEIRKQDPVLLTAMVFGMVQQVAAVIVAGRLKGSLGSKADSLVASSWRVLKG